MKFTITTLLLCLVVSASLVFAAPEAAVTPAPVARHLERRQDFWTLISQATANLNPDEIASFNSLLEGATNYGDLFTNSGVQSALSGANGQGSAISSLVSADSGILTSSLDTATLNTASPDTSAAQTASPASSTLPSSVSSAISRLTSQLSSLTSGATRSPSPTATTTAGQDGDNAQPDAAVMRSGLGGIGAALVAVGAGAALIIAAL